MNRQTYIRVQELAGLVRRSQQLVDALLKEKVAPSKKAAAKHRAAAICRHLLSEKGWLSTKEMRWLAKRQDLPYGAVGALSAGGYVRRTGRGFELTQKGRSFARQA